MMRRSSGELHLRQIVTLLKRRRGFIFTSMIVGAALAAAAAALLPPRYTAKAQILREAELRDGVEAADDAAVDTLVELLLSPNHLRRLAASLAETPAGTGAAPDFETLSKNLNVFKERRSRLIGITYVSTDPAVAAEVANRAVRLHLDNVANREAALRAKTLEALKASLDAAREELVRSEDALRAHRIAFGVSDAARRDDAARQIAELNAQLRISRSKLAEAEARLDRSARRAAAGSPAEPPEGLRLSAMTDAAGPIAPTPAQLHREADRLTQDVAVHRARIEEIESRLATLRSASESAGAAETRLRELEREARAAGQLYENLLRRTAELRSSPPARAPVRIVTKASPPERPSSPSPVLFIFPALLASGLLSGLGAVVLERLDERLRSERDAQEELGAPCIGLVPRLRLRRKMPAGAILPADPFDPYTEAIRGIVAAAARLDRQEGRPVVHLFTGSAEGDGATTTAICFALYAARLRRKVLLMDLDFRRPSVMRALRDAADPDSARAADSSEDYLIVPAPDLGIDVMPAPRSKADPLELLSRQEFHDLMTRLREAYDCIVIDSAPAAKATETRQLSLAADHVIFAVRWGVTEASDARAGLRNLRAARPDGSAPVSVVITQVNMRLHRRRRYGASAVALAPEEGGLA